MLPLPPVHQLERPTGDGLVTDYASVLRRVATRLHQRIETYVPIYEVCRRGEPSALGKILLSEPLDEVSDDPARATQSQRNSELQWRPDEHCRQSECARYECDGDCSCVYDGITLSPSVTRLNSFHYRVLRW